VVVSCEIAGNAFPGQEHREKELQDLAVARGVADQVRLLGYVDDIDALLTRAGIFAMPSTRPEPFGLALVDAMARGLASIASDAGGPKEIIRHEVTGLLVPPGDAGALADAIERLSGDPTLRQRLGRAAAEDVRTRFSIDMTARRVGEVYEHLLRRATA
jgi:glycosyltransferase involved in cell wall biosynthesis